MFNYEVGKEMIDRLRKGELTGRFLDSLRADEGIRKVERYILEEEGECRILGIKPYDNPPKHEALVAAYGILGR